MTSAGQQAATMSVLGSVLLIGARPTEPARLAEYLHLVGIEVRRAESGLHALTQLERGLPDAVVCEAQLEDMSGLELLDIVRSDDQLRQVVFLLLNGQENASFGPYDAAIAGDATPAEIVQELRPVFRRGAKGAPRRVAGNLITLGLESVLLALQQGQRDGRLRVFTLSSDADVWLARGQVVSARYATFSGEAALNGLLEGTRVLLNADYTFEATMLPSPPRLHST